MLTEEEAKTKWCPMVRRLATFREESFGVVSAVRVAGSYNRAASDSAAEHSRCIASGCMMWREGGVQHGPVLERVPMKAGESRPDGFTGAIDDHWIRQEATPLGFCGLAR